MIYQLSKLRPSTGNSISYINRRFFRPSLQNLKGTKASQHGPIAQPKPFSVKFGKVYGETRGKDDSLLIDPPIERVDYLYWLRDDTRKCPAVLHHVKEENAYAADRTAALEELRKKLSQENIATLQEDRDALPFVLERNPKYAYFIRERKGFPYKTYCRVSTDTFNLDAYITKRSSQPNSPVHSTQAITGEEVLLDVNQLAKTLNSNFCIVHSFHPHPTDDSVFAYSVDLRGQELFEIRFVGKPWDSIQNTSGEFEWSPDGSRLFYITRDEAQRPYKVWMREVESGKETCIFEEADKLFEPAIQMSLCQSFLVILTSSQETTEIHLLDVRESKNQKLMCVRKREFGCRYFAMPHSNGDLIVLTNSNNAKNSYLLKFRLESTKSKERDIITHFADGETLVPHSNTRYLQEMRVFKNHIVLYGREDGLSQIWILSIPQKELSRVAMPDSLYSVRISKQNYVFDTDRLVLNYSTPREPTAKYSLNLASLKMCRISETKLTGYDPTDYDFRRLEATSPDGTKVHISMILPKGTQKNRDNRIIMLGYGAYGDSSEPRFRARWVPYLKRGMICCIAHVRGGAENGHHWYELSGKYLCKRNTFTDFIACAEHLIQEGWTQPKHLAIEGRSAGGLLIGAVLNMRPDLFQVAVANVPFVDVMGSMCDATIPLTAGEWEEWGNPNEYRFHDYMLSYSPIDNVRAQKYPHILLLGGWNDTRVMYWEPLKFASKLRAATTGTNDIIVRIETDAGHFSASDRYRHLHELAFQQAYVISKLFSQEEIERQTTK